MQRYRDKKIRVCDKNSIPLILISFTACLGVEGVLLKKYWNEEIRHINPKTKNAYRGYLDQALGIMNIQQRSLTTNNCYRCSLEDELFFFTRFKAKCLHFSILFIHINKKLLHILADEIYEEQEVVLFCKQFQCSNSQTFFNFTVFRKCIM